jgi:hypothetical protein
MRDVADSTPGLDFYLLCEPICVSLISVEYILINKTNVCVLIFGDLVITRLVIGW